MTSALLLLAVKVRVGYIATRLSNEAAAENGTALPKRQGTVGRAWICMRAQRDRLQRTPNRPIPIFASLQEGDIYDDAGG